MKFKDNGVTPGVPDNFTVFPNVSVGGGAYNSSELCARRRRKKFAHQRCVRSFHESGKFSQVLSMVKLLILYRISRIIETKTVGLLFLIILVFLPTSIYSSEVQKGDSVIIVTLGVRARLCPYPDCGQDAHIARIPEGTILVVRMIMNIALKLWTVPWYQVNYRGTTGWISMYDTKIAPSHLQSNLESQVAYLYIETLPENSRIRILSMRPKFHQGRVPWPLVGHACLDSGSSPE